MHPHVLVRGRPTALVGRLAAAACLAAAVVACVTGTSSGPSGGSLAPSGGAVPGSVEPSTEPSPSAAGVSAEPVPTVPAAVPFDESLLALLPERVGGIALTSDPDTGATLGSDPDLVGVAAELAYAVAVDPATDDFALVAVVRFEPDVVDEAFFRDWRDSFDEGACSQAGGVQGHAEAEIGGRRTFIGSCAGGLLTYHVLLEGERVIVSVSSLGEDRLGEEVVRGLRP